MRESTTTATRTRRGTHTGRTPHPRWAWGVVCCAVLVWAVGCQDRLSAEDWEVLRTLGPLTPSAELPESPTNAWADDPEAALLGQALFFDKGLSADGTVSCASCHDPSNGFADLNPLSQGVEGRLGERHAPTLINLAFQDAYFWDGRTDSLWSTPLQAIEAPPEADFTRVEVVHLIVNRYRSAYEAIYGPLPEFANLPARARPGLPDWDTMNAEDQDAVNRVFSNVGKALEAYQRKLTCFDTRFDRIVAGEGSFSREEEEGARAFVRSDEGNCVACHNGLNLSDNAFHRLPLPGLRGFPDPGRREGIPKLLENTFNTVGAYSDDTGFGRGRVNQVRRNQGTGLGRFKTPTLRGVAQRRTFGHLGNVNTLNDWLDDVYEEANPNATFASEARGLEFEGDDMAAFLKTLNCAPIPAELLGPPARLPGDNPSPEVSQTP